MSQKAPWHPNSSKQLYRTFLLSPVQQLTIAHTHLLTLGSLSTPPVCGTGPALGRMVGSPTTGERVGGGRRTLFDGRHDGAEVTIQKSW